LGSLGKLVNSALITAYSEAGETQLEAIYRNISGGTEENKKEKLFPI
jgi:acetyl-CoA carboxylase beta subunit